MRSSRQPHLHANRPWGTASILIVVLVALLAGAAPAPAAPAEVTIDSLEPTLKVDEDGSGEVTLGFTNLTDKPIGLKARLAGSLPGCRALRSKPAALGPAQHTEVEFAVPARCEPGEGVVIEVDALTEAAPPQTFGEIQPEVDAAVEKPDWDQLWVFAAALGASLLLVFVIFAVWWLRNGTDKPSLFTPLSSLDSAWEFGDNWVTNVTAVGGLLTGIFGATDVATAFLGPDAESAIALATVGAAIALAFVAAGPVILLATKSYKPQSRGKPRGDAFTVGGLLLAAAMILTSAFGQLAVVYLTGQELDLGGLQDSLWIPFVAAAILLIFYTWRSLTDLLERGTAPKPKPPTPPEVEAAKLVLAALEAEADVDEDVVVQALEQVNQTYDPNVVSAPEAYEQRTRSALL